MIKHVEHIGVAVADLSEAQPIFDHLFGQPAYKEEAVASEGVKTLFYQLGQTKIELLEAQNEQSAIAKYIAKRGQGMHHLAFEVDDIRAEMHRLQEAGFLLLNDAPKVGADNKLICFLHPKSTGGVLVELCQDQG